MPNKRKRVDGEAKELGKDKCPNQGDGDRDGRDNRAAPSLQEKENYDDHDQDGFRQRLEHFADRFADGARRIKCHLIFQSHGETLGQLLDPRSARRGAPASALALESCITPRPMASTPL